VSATILEVDNLTVTFDTDEGVFNAVEAVSFAIAAGEVVGLVGESGCGKSVTALSILRLIPSPPGRITAGSVRFKGADLAALSAAELRRVRGSGISMIFQEPSAALSPLHRVGRQLVEALRLHRDLSRRAAWEAARDWLEKVRIPDAAERLYAYPFQLSGGMQQRVMIAMALMLEPEVIIADEPTTALDVTIQAQVFALIREMKQASTAILLITHDMGVVWEMCDRVLVMYAARIVEAGTREEIFEKPAHPYTRGLLRSIPRLTDKPERLATIGGMVPSPLHYPAGCRFNDRCPHVFDRCRHEAPGLLEVSAGHRAACFLAKKLVRAPL